MSPTVSDTTVYTITTLTSGLGSVKTMPVLSYANKGSPPAGYSVIPTTAGPFTIQSDTSFSTTIPAWNIDVTCDDLTLEWLYNMLQVEIATVVQGSHPFTFDIASRVVTFTADSLTTARTFNVLIKAEVLDNQGPENPCTNQAYQFLVEPQCANDVISVGAVTGVPTTYYIGVTGLISITVAITHSIPYCDQYSYWEVTDAAGAAVPGYLTKVSTTDTLVTLSFTNSNLVDVGPHTY